MASTEQHSASPPVLDDEPLSQEVQVQPPLSEIPTATTGRKAMDIIPESPENPKTRTSTPLAEHNEMIVIDEDVETETVQETQPLTLETDVTEIMQTQPFDLFDPTMYGDVLQGQGTGLIDDKCDEDEDLWNPPIIHLANPRHEAFLYCYAKEFAKHFPDVQVCNGCRYDLLSQVEHNYCSTQKNMVVLRESEVAVDETAVSLAFGSLLIKLNLDPPVPDEVSLLMKKASGAWKNLVVRAVVYGFSGFPADW